MLFWLHEVSKDKPECCLVVCMIAYQSVTEAVVEMKGGGGWEFQKSCKKQRLY